MGAIVQTLGNGFTAVGNWLAGLLGAVWTAVLTVLDVAWAVVVQLIGWILLGLAGVLGFVLQLLVGLMPAAPVAQEGAYAGFSSLSAANQYVPIAEAFALLPLMAAVAGGIGVYKLVKFIRGGG